MPRLLVETRRSWSSAGAAVEVLLVLALVAELASSGCFSALSRVLLPSAARPPYPVMLAIDVTGNGFSHVVPGGGAAAAALRFRLLARVGVPPSDAVGAAAAALRFRLLARVGVPPSDAVGAAALESAISVLWLAAALVIGLVAAVPAPETHPFLKTALVLAVVSMTTFGGLVAVLAVRPDLVVTVTAAIADRLPLVQQAGLERLVRAVLLQVRLVVGNRSRRTRAVLWGLGNWTCDALALYLCVWAFGDPPSVGALLTTYALVSLIALLPLTPGGLGLVEGVAVPVLLSFGTGQEAALLGVLAWRLFAFWLPIPLAGGAYLWLRRGTAGAPAGGPS
ncbi:YbhN family protein [Nocardioides sp. QY071]|uniref:lysylphosphatidylglycerol synthase transmembrane domain-containing protein n=1 Tax=Nocardioides sp. QY071 TaxID=3044187 RepID=UPI0032B81C68